MQSAERALRAFSVLLRRGLNRTPDSRLEETLAFHHFQGAVVSALTGLAVMMPPLVGAQVPELPDPKVSAVGRFAVELVKEGRERSPTFRRLLNEIESSDWIVFVQTGSCRLPGILGCLLHRVGTFEGQRYIRIVLSEGSFGVDEAIATIGHELQHAAEVVTDPRVREAADIRALYRRIGYVSQRGPRGEVYETRGAVRVGATIRAELRAERRSAERVWTASR